MHFTSAFESELEEYLVAERDAVDEQPVWIARRRSEGVLHDPVHPEALALIEAQCAHGAGSRRHDQAPAAALSTAGDHGLDQVTAEPTALACLEDGDALQLELARHARLDDLGLTDDQLTVPGDEHLAERDIQGDLGRRIIGQGEEGQQRLAIGVVALDARPRRQLPPRISGAASGLRLPAPGGSSTRSPSSQAGSPVS